MVSRWARKILVTLLVGLVTAGGLGASIEPAASLLVGQVHIEISL